DPQVDVLERPEVLERDAPAVQDALLQAGELLVVKPEALRHALNFDGGRHYVLRGFAPPPSTIGKLALARCSSVRGGRMLRAPRRSRPRGDGTRAWRRPAAAMRWRRPGQVRRRTRGSRGWAAARSSAGCTWG